MPDGTGTVPLILFSHGLGGSLNGGGGWAESWRRAGFAVVNLQHAGSDRSVIGRGLFRAINAEQLVARAGDVRFAIDRIAATEREGQCDLGRIDLKRIGMSSHSFGARTTQAIAGRLGKGDRFKAK